MLLCAEGHVIPPDAPEQLCPTCLVSPVARRSLGPLQLLELLGEGGFGMVYRARHEGQDVAVKVLRGWEFASGEAVARFRREPMLSATLRPEYVVRVLTVGEHGGVPYFTMEYLAGGTLRERMPEYRGNPERAAELMIQVATAVQSLHYDPDQPERASILHRDLKPENILFGADGKPRISDFGIAKLAKDATFSYGTRPVGCPAYMAPEQAFPNGRRKLTCAADVYALGAILYELFTGRPPFDGTTAEILSQLREQEPEPPRRRLAPNLDRFLQSVVLSALEKDPANRYRSAAAFAQDLSRALQNKPPEQAPSIARSARIRACIRRHPLAAAAGVWAISLVTVIGGSVHATLAARERDLERDQQINASVAGMQAVAVNLQLQGYKHRLSELAQEAEMISLLTAESVPNPSPAIQARLAPFDTLFVMAPDGRQTARSSLKSPEYLARRFDFRDYFKGAQQLGLNVCGESAGPVSGMNAGTAYISRAYTSESDGHFEFAISAPLCMSRRWVGIIAGTVASDKVLGAVRLLDDHHGRIATVLGPRDRERAEKDLPLPNDLTFIVHPGLAHGQSLRLLEPEPSLIRAALGIAADTGAEANPRRLRYAAPLRVDDYHDPVPGFAGAWAAVFAAADESGYLVAVQSRRDVTPLAREVMSKLALPAGIPFSVGLLGWYILARRRRRV